MVVWLKIKEEHHLPTWSYRLGTSPMSYHYH